MLSFSLLKLLGMEAKRRHGLGRCSIEDKQSYFVVLHDVLAKASHLASKEPVGKHIAHLHGGL